MSRQFSRLAAQRPYVGVDVLFSGTAASKGFVRTQCHSRSSSSMIAQTINQLSPSHPTNDRTTDEQKMLSQMSPLKRILCLTPVPLGRGRVSWSGGDSLMDETRGVEDVTQMQPLKTKRFRYGERFALGVAVSDPYLSHAVPVHLSNENQFTAQIVPTFVSDSHSLGSSPIFHTTLPCFKNDLLNHIGHFDIGRILLAMPMRPSSPRPTKLQLEQELNLVDVSKCLMAVLQNYDTGKDLDLQDSTHDEVQEVNGDKEEVVERHQVSFAPLSLYQAHINHRLSISDVLSRSDNDYMNHESWSHLAEPLLQIQNHRTAGGSNAWRSVEYGSHNVFKSVPAELHAAVALNSYLCASASAAAREERDSEDHQR